VVRARGYEAAGLEKILTKLNIQVAETPNFLRMAVAGSPLVIPDTRKESGWVNFEGTEFVRSYMGTPILMKGRVVGFINLDSTKPDAFNSNHADSLQIFADQAAIAIENARMFEKVEQMAIVDTLTGLYNRRHFFDLGEREIERYKRYHSPLSLIMLDLDHFKKVNDQYGHQVGDYVLQELAKIFANSLRKMDIPGRLGGEEFVILLPETNIDQGMLVAERIRKTVEAKNFIVEDHSIHITASMGLVSMRDDVTSLQMLISLADKIMYKAKAAGRNKVLAADDHHTINP
jgi:diguanylate cyclase (GGDEF)-like protein